MTKTKSIYDYSYHELLQQLENLGEPAFRIKQLWGGLYKNLNSSAGEFTVFTDILKQKLKDLFLFSTLTKITDLTASDGTTRKILFGLPDNSQIETVLMCYRKRNTVCISTQAGCGLACTFCATGQAGLQRNLSAGEITEQVIFFDRILRDKNEKITNVVMMGMGEPFANYDEVMKSIRILNDENGYNFGERRITISTVGLIPQIKKFAEEKNHSNTAGIQVNLAVSLHAATDELRNSMIPLNKKYPLSELIDACRYYISKTNRRISFEWAMINGVNDTTEQAKKLSKIVKRMLCHVNLIPLNPTKNFTGAGSDSFRIKKFREILSENNIPNTVRVRRGIDIHAGCGQLRQTLISS
jgi:23S rRNA (adenine2503-C2)-methyltransferase